MRGFELTEEKERFLAEGLADRAVPGADRLGRATTRRSASTSCAASSGVLGVDDPVLLPAKHFLQEDQAPPLAYAIADHVAPLG